MKYLLDTHVWLWMMDSPQNVPKKVYQVLAQEPVPMGISVITLWETAKLVEKRRIALALPVSDWLHNALESGFVRKIHLDEHIAIEATQLPGEFHRDPADQIIVATARVHNLTLITADRKILAYRHVRTLWD